MRVGWWDGLGVCWQALYCLWFSMLSGLDGNDGG